MFSGYQCTRFRSRKQENIGRLSRQSDFIAKRRIFRTGGARSFLFFLLFDEPILEVFGEYLHVSFFHNVVDDCGGDFQLCHSLVRPLPKPVLLSGCVGQIELGYQLTEFAEHYRIEVVVIP